MKPYATYAAVLALLLADAMFVEAQVRDYRGHSLDLLRILAEKPWLGIGPHNRWDRSPHIDMNLATSLDPWNQHINMYTNDALNNYSDDDDGRVGAKRSAMVTKLKSNRRRRQPASSFGKAVTSYPSVGLLGNMGFFFDAMSNNMDSMASLSPHQRNFLFPIPPTVVHAPSSSSTGGGGGVVGGTGIRKQHTLHHPLPHSGIRSYNRRSFVQADGGYPGANHHNPELLWTGLGR